MTDPVWEYEAHELDAVRADRRLTVAQKATWMRLHYPFEPGESIAAYMTRVFGKPPVPAQATGPQRINAASVFGEPDPNA